MIFFELLEVLKISEFVGPPHIFVRPLILHN